MPQVCAVLRGDLGVRACGWNRLVPVEFNERCIYAPLIDFERAIRLEINERCS